MVRNSKTCNPSSSKITRIQLWVYFCQKSSGDWCLQYDIRLFLLGSYFGGVMPNNINEWEIFGLLGIVTPIDLPSSDQIWGWHFQWSVQRSAPARQMFLFAILSHCELYHHTAFTGRGATFCLWMYEAHIEWSGEYIPKPWNKSGCEYCLYFISHRLTFSHFRHRMRRSVPSHCTTKHIRRKTEADRQ